MRSDKLVIPYLQLIQTALDDRDPAFLQAFDDDIHWGYWPDGKGDSEAGPASFRHAAQRLTTHLLRSCERLDGLVVVDVGCGHGGTIRTLAGRGAALRAGINIDERQLRRAAVPTDDARYIAADGCTLPLRSASVDLVIAIESVFHFASRTTFLAECARVLADDGRVLVADFLAASWLARPAGAWPRRPANSLFGRTNLRATVHTYTEAAQSCGLELVTTEDLTRATMPTYRILGQVCRHRLDRRQRAALRTLHAASRLGLVRYCLVELRNPSAAASR
jgi:MPBQ/MSBQ methyltransferase